MRTPALCLLLTVPALIGAACSGDDTPTQATTSAPPSTSAASASSTTVLDDGDGTFTVRTETFVDESRSTAEKPGRSLVTDIYVPGGDGPFPVIVHAHGMDGTSAKFSELLGRWAEAGYLVVAPNFPRTNGGAPPELRSVGDYVEQPGDLDFVLDQVLAQDSPAGELEGLIASDHMGISGLSLGGVTTYASLFHPCCADERYSSAVLMSAFELPFEGGEPDWSARGEFPILVFAGTADAAIRYELQQEVIAGLPGPTWSVTLLDGAHSAPFENSAAPHDDLVARSTVDFWDLTLRGDDAAADRLVSDAEVDGLSSVQFVP